VRWIGGGSAAGKSTIGRRIAAQKGLQLYSTDDVMAEHARRCTPDSAPFLTEFVAMDMDERWLDRSPEAMLETFHWFRGEGFDLIVEDLLRLPTEPAVIVEGFRLLPHLVQPFLAEPTHAVWLLPTPEFRRAASERRGSSQWAFLDATSNPARARRNLLERDRLFTDRLRAETARLNLPAIEVDTTMTETELTARVTKSLGL
jgi:2-phosphoglycerate kinase